MENCEIIPVSHSQIEGNIKIKGISCYIVNYFKISLFVILSFATLGILPLLTYWIHDLRIVFIFSRSNFEKCTHFLVTSWEYSETMVKKEVEVSQIDFEKRVFFKYRFMKYVFCPTSFCFSALEFPFQNEIANKIPEKYEKGLDSISRLEKNEVFGESGIEFPIPTIFEFFFKDLLNPYTLFQIISIIFWIFGGYYISSLVIAALTILSTFYTAFNVNQGLKSLYGRIQSKSEYRIKCDSQQLSVPSNSIVPGDVVILETGMKATCDMVLLNGEILVNESNLTGESHLQRKFNVATLGNTIFDPFKHQKQIIFDGSKIKFLSNRNVKGDSQILGLVIRTGISTLRGQIIRSILFPQQTKFNFFLESLKFLFFVSILSVSGFLIVLPKFLDFFSDGKIVFNFFNLYTITIPPSLPGALSFGVTFAINYLRKFNISTFRTNEIIEGGTVDTICFDKTGTLTKSALELKGLKCWFGNQEQDLITNETLHALVNSTNSFHEIINCATSCVSLAKYESLQGDPLDISIFKFLDGTLKDPNSIQSLTGENLEILKIFEFSSDKQAMSVISKIENMGIYFISKGSPEVILANCKANTLPNDNKQIVDSFSRKGFRILAIASLKLENDCDIYNVKESEMRDLKFLGYLIFENKLKMDSPFIIKEFDDANLQMKIISGDNLLTCVHTALECGIISNSNVTLIDFEESPKMTFTVKNEEFEGVNRQSRVSRGSIQIEMKSISKTKFSSLQNEQNEKDITKEFIAKLQRSIAKNNSIAISGRAFTELQNIIHTHDVFPRLLRRCQVYGRMLPQQKAQLIELLRSLGLSCAMCGDGSNDSVALKKANLGLAICEGDASLSAPFATTGSSIKNLFELVKACRSGLSTSFQAFKLICSFSLIQFATSVILFYNYSELTDMQYIWIYIFIQAPFMCTFAMTDPQEKLSKIKPELSIFTIEHVVSVIGNVFIQIMAQVSAVLYLQVQNFDVPFNGKAFFEENDKLQRDNLVTSSLFIFSNFLYVGIILIYSIPTQFRKGFHTGFLLSGNIFIVWLLCVLLATFPSLFSEIIFVPEIIRGKFLIGIILLAHFWTAMILAFEVAICQKLIGEIIERRNKIKFAKI